MRAVEIKADAIFKATKVDGVYSDDPIKNKDAIRFDQLSYQDVLQKELQVMDSTAITLSMDNQIPIMVFDLTQPGNIKKAISKENIGTIIGVKQ